MKCSRCQKEIADESMFCNYCGKRQISAPVPQRRRRRRPKGSGSVYMSGSSRTCPWVAVDGTGAYIGRFASSGEAVKALDSHNEKKLPAQRSRYTLVQIYNSFTASQRYEKLAKSGREGLSVAWKRLQPLANRPALSITIDEYQAIIDSAMVTKRYKEYSHEEYAMLTKAQKARYEKLKSQPPEPLGYDGKNRIKQLVSHLYNEMIWLGILDKNENRADLLVLPPQPASHKRNFTASEKMILEANSSDDTVKIILIYLYTGMRLGELLKCKRSDVDIDGRVIIGGSKTKAGRERRIPIIEKCLPLIQHFYLRGGVYLIEENHKPITEETFRRGRFYPKLAELGIQYQDADGKNILTPHRTRHTMAADAIKSEVDPVALSKVLGHTKFSVTVDKYADDLDSDFLKDEIEKISG